MQLWMVLLGSVLTLGAIAALARVKISFDIRARGEPDGMWLAACGAALGPLAVATVGARGAPLRAELHLFGRRLPLPVRRKQRERPQKPADPERPRERAGAPTSASRVVERLEDVLDLGLHAGRRVDLEALDADLVYGFRDVALTGSIAGALAAISGVLPSPVRLTHTPRWSEPERWSVQVAGAVGIRAGLVLKDLLWYMLRGRLRRRAPSSRAKPRRADESPGNTHG